MEIKENILLAPYTTFKIGGPAGYFCLVNNEHDAVEAFDFAKGKNLRVFVLGGGSNILVSDQGFKGLVLKVENKGVEILSEDNQNVSVKVASGEIWDEVVKMAVDKNWWGIENLSHIPGNTGAIAVQNVGAYGQEAKDVIDSVEVYDKTGHTALVLKNSDCGFAYRKSIFNSSAKGRYIIFSIIFKLRKDAAPNLSYRDLKNRFGDKRPTIQEVRQAVTQIRDQKFPYPVEAKNGNAGSFFKNPSVSKDEYVKIRQTIELKIGQPASEALDKKIFNDQALIKIPAAYLLEICGVKDLEVGGAAINHNQPLVIINKTGGATAEDVLSLAKTVKDKVFGLTGVVLEQEPELVGF